MGEQFVEENRDQLVVDLVRGELGTWPCEGLWRQVECLPVVWNPGHFSGVRRGIYKCDKRKAGKRGL